MEFQPSIRNHAGGSTSGRSFDMTSPTAQGSTNLIAISVIYFDHGLVSGCHKKWWHVVSSYLFFGRVSRTSEKSIKRSGSWYSESWLKRKSTGKPYTCMCVYIYIYIQDDVDNERCVLQVQKPFSIFRYRSSEVVEFSLPRVAKQMVLPGSILRTGWAPTNILLLCCFDLVRLNGYLMI